MKPNIHPEYNEITVHCACGAKWQTRTTSKIDTEGRVDRFTKKFGAQTVEQRKTAAKAVKDAKAKTAKKKTA